MLSCAPLTAERAENPDLERWERQAHRVTIVRDDWGVAHLHGRTDADAVFEMIYAQAEDDFNRVETNYINAMGRLAEAEGESAVWQDLRMKLFIDPDALMTPDHNRTFLSARESPARPPIRRSSTSSSATGPPETGFERP